MQEGHEAGAGPNPTPFDDLLSDYRESLDEVGAETAATRDRPDRGPDLSWFPRLEEVLGETLVPGLHVIFGDSAAPPSAFAFKLACHASCRTVYVTTDMSPRTFVRHVIVEAKDLTLDEIRRREKDRSFHELDPGGSYLHLYRLDSYSSPVDAVAVAAMCRNMKEATGRMGHGYGFFVIIDSFPTWAQSVRPEMEPYAAVEQGVSDARQVSRSLGCPVLLVCDRYEFPARPGSVEPGPGTHFLRYSATTMLDLNAVPAEDQHMVDLTVLRNIHGSVGNRIQFRFDDLRGVYRVPGRINEQ